MTIIEQERKDRLEEILRQVEFLLENDETLEGRSDLMLARLAISDILKGMEASNAQS